MVAVGLKGLPAGTKTCDFAEDRSMGEQEKSRRRGKWNKVMNTKPKNSSIGFDKDKTKESISGRGSDGDWKAAKSSKYQNTSEPHSSRIRKQVDPETIKYFSEIANLLESNGIDLEERTVICGNALEEATGKEYELATDYIISHTLQSLLEECEIYHLCGFLRNCAKDFPSIAMDRSGSHVLETALKSLYMHLQDKEASSIVEETLTKICQVIVKDPVDVMCNCHGSHVLRSLLCLCKGVPLDSHVTKSSMILADRLNLKSSRMERSTSTVIPGFPDLLTFLISGLSRCVEKDIASFQVNQYSSLVLQTALKFLVEHEQELLQTILILLGCHNETPTDRNFMDRTTVQNIVDMMKETAFSHLMEVIVEVSPEVLYNEMLIKVFKNTLFDLSSDPCGNFVVQALVSHARSKDQELGTKFRELLEMGKSGVIASLVAASQRLHSHEHKCCQALAAAICGTDESSRCIVPRLLFLDNYFGCEDKANWMWVNGAKMHVMGSLILQEVFRHPSEHIQPYITSITSMESEHLLQTAKDSSGARVIEAFLASKASGKQKRRLVVKLRGHFGELAMHSSGSFTVEKCFNTSSVSQRESIVSELVAVRAELFKRKQGPYLLRKLDVDRFASQPDQWRSNQASKQSAYSEFCNVFGSVETAETKSSTIDNFLSGSSKGKSRPKKLKEMKKEIDKRLDSSAQFLSMSGSKRRQGKGNNRSNKRQKEDSPNKSSKKFRT